MTRNFIYKNSYIILPVFIFWCIGISILITNEKGSEVIYLAQHRNGFLDSIFSSITQLAELPVYAIVIGLLFITNMKNKAITVLAAGLITTLVSYLLKDFFQEPRPALYFSQMGLINSLKPVPGVKLNSGYTSYPSGHTMAAFSLFITLALLWPTKKIFGVFCVIMAILVAISRIYLGQHFLSDVVSGSMVGLYLSAFSYYFIYKNLRNRKQNLRMHNH